MTQTLVQALLADKTPGTVALYGTATGANTVKVGASNVAVTLPALSPVVAGDYCLILATGADRVIVGAVGGTTPWTAVTFKNSWVNAGGARQVVQYRQMGDMVYVRGNMKSGSNAAVAFTLPVGPPAEIPISIGSYNTGPVGAVVVVFTNGDVKIIAASTTDVAINFSFSVTA